MITKEKIEKLEMLTEHPRYGKLLKDAINSWKENKPDKFQFGLSISKIEDKDFYDRDFDYGCCLIGAGLIKKQVNVSKSIFSNAVEIFNLSEIEINGLMIGFDESILYPNHFSKNESDQLLLTEAYNFGKQVSEIIFN